MLYKTITRTIVLGYFLGVKQPSLLSKTPNYINISNNFCWHK
ncbi:hypothetical protein HMPREF9144_2691 [Prevotella pallens ATCC 700821]|uniref:Uncharacterized protein n=1 Tax=Prevotella pallens ATCC 700821 TaxID=997353 RepID=F9DLZ9_9BACT|nr:hypothetical protein HMPREF9144_2691 [Prevotella pallens ATCC 700821]